MKSKKVTPPIKLKIGEQVSDPVCAEMMHCGTAQSTSTVALNWEFNFPTFTTQTGIA